MTHFQEIAEALSFNTSWIWQPDGDGVTRVTYTYDSLEGNQLSYISPTVFTPAQRIVADSVLLQYSNVAKLEFENVATTTSDGADIVLLSDDLGAFYKGFAAGPGSDEAQGGDVQINVSYNGENPLYSLAEGDVGYWLFMHEIGHAVGGFSDVSVANTLTNNEDNVGHTVMSYFGTAIDNSLFSDVDVADYISPHTLMIYDIAALQFLYGANHNYMSGDTVWNLNDMDSDGGNDTYFGTIWDGNSNTNGDTLDASAFDGNFTYYMRFDGTPVNDFDADVIIDLREGYEYFSKVGASFTWNAFGANIENAVSSLGNDELYGNDLNNKLEGREGEDTLTGFSGNDTLKGGVGGDRLNGGIGDDSLDGGIGVDTIIIKNGDGDDTINGLNWDTTEQLVLNDINSSNIIYDYSQAENTIITYGTTDSITIVDKNDVSATDIVFNTGPTDVYLSSEEYVERSGEFVVGDLTTEDLNTGDIFTYSMIDDANGYFVATSDPFNDLRLLSTFHNTVVSGESYDITIRSTDQYGLFTDKGFTITIIDNPNIIYALDGITDTVDGTAGDDTIHGRNDQDILNGHDGNDTIRGRSGNDTLNGGLNADKMYGEIGDDELNGDDGNDTLIGDIGADTLDGGDGIDWIYGNVGDDLLYGGNHDDKLFGDEVFGGKGKDTLYGQAGDDSLEGRDGNDFLNGGDGRDTLRGGSGVDTLEGGDGDDSIIGGSHGDVISGGNGNDTMVGGFNKDTFVFTHETDASDVINDFNVLEDIIDIRDASFEHVRDGTEPVVITQDALDSVIDIGFSHTIRVLNTLVEDLSYENILGITPNSQLVIIGTDDPEIIDGKGGKDTIFGLGGGDTIDGSWSNDYIYGNQGDDSLDGGEDDDVLFGGDGEDILRGGNLFGRDLLFGGDGNDSLWGDPGADTVVGGKGDDWMIFDGYLDIDTYVFELEVGATDTISRSALANSGHIIDLSHESFSNITSFDDLSSSWREEGIDLYLLLGSGHEIRLRWTDPEDLTSANFKFYTAPTEGADSITGTFLDDNIVALGGDDIVNASYGNDRIFGGSGTDILNGGAGNDSLHANGGYGQGGDGLDVLDGGAGNDWLQAGDDVNTMTGGTGADTFRFGVGTSTESERDVITDFEDGDKIDVTGFGFSNMLTGSNSGTQHSLYQQHIGGNTIIHSFKSDFSVELTGVHNLDNGDFTGLTGGGGGKIICTELHRQGLMSESLFKADQEFGRYLAKNDPEVLIGYWLWAQPIVNMMKKSRVFTHIIKFLAMSWANEMAHQMGATEKRGGLFGKILMKVGIPACRVIGKLMNRRKTVQDNS